MFTPSNTNGKLRMSEFGCHDLIQSNLQNLHDSASADIERDLADLPQAKSQMMASFENQQENFFKPPNVYR